MLAQEVSRKLFLQPFAFLLFNIVLNYAKISRLTRVRKGTKSLAKKSMHLFVTNSSKCKECVYLKNLFECLLLSVAILALPSAWPYVHFVIFFFPFIARMDYVSTIKNLFMKKGTL